MTGGIHFETKVKVPPGDTHVIDRLQLDGTFGLTGVRFTSPEMQQRIASLSHRAQGEPDDHDPGVTADFRGDFHLLDGRLSLPDLQFTLPGANVSLRGSYALRSGALDFRGPAKLDATVSQMTTGFACRMLKPLDRFFSRDGAGTRDSDSHQRHTRRTVFQAGCRPDTATQLTVGPSNDAASKHGAPFGANV